MPFIDGFLELYGMRWATESGNRPTSVGGESRDAKKAGGTETKYGANREGAMEVLTFGFGSAQAMARAKQLADRDDEDEDDDTVSAKEMNAKAKARKRRKARQARGEDDSSEDKYRFQITKEVDISSPVLMLAYMSNSHRDGRCIFDRAKVTLRKSGADVSGPRTYLTFVFEDVYVVGYQLETKETEPPEETVAFCFLSCVMEYKPQASSGGRVGDEGEDGLRPNASGWNFALREQILGAEVS